MNINTLITNFLHINIRHMMLEALKFVDEEDLQEIRVRLNKPLEIKVRGKSHLLLKSGLTTSNTKKAFIVDEEAFNFTLSKVSNYSLYAFKEELKNGFITLAGGHRVGVIGDCVTENGEIKAVKDITSLNIRLAHEVYGVSKSVRFIYKNGVTNTLIVSPPSCGKTTLLRDLIRFFSDSLEKTVGVVDERYEICNLHNVGVRVDVISNCPKSLGMINLLRTMSPDIICVDEIGKKEDVSSILELFNCGINLVATIHAKDIEELQKKENIKQLIVDKYFDNYIVLSKNFKDKPLIYDKNFKEVING